MINYYHLLLLLLPLLLPYIIVIITINVTITITTIVIYQISNNSSTITQTFKETWKVDIGHKEEQAFQQLRSPVHSSNLLIHYDLEKLLMMAYDVSPYGIGTLLSHIIPKEVLAIKFAVKRFHQNIMDEPYNSN